MLARMFESLSPHLDERTRRLAAASAASAAGHGGIRGLAQVTGLRERTIADGIAELESGDPLVGRVRRAGGGRKRSADLDSGLVTALLALVEPDMRGDPMSPLRWTTKSTRNLAEVPTGRGHRVSADTVGDLLRESGFSLQGNAKTVEGTQHPDRDAQFRYINTLVKGFRDAGSPVVSVDAKKKEQIGPFANAGREWQPVRDPVKVRDHDFPDPELGKAVPYGIYDMAANAGWVTVGTDHDTAAFAVACLRRGWDTVGRVVYPHSTRLLITADSGGSNGYRTRAWKTELAAFARDTGLEVTVCHFPPGTSKWNAIEHRLFSHITMNWRGRPLTSHEVVVNTIAATTTRAGLAAHAELDTNTYPIGVKINPARIDALPLNRHDWHGDWNYTLRAEPYPHIPIAPAPATTRPHGPPRLHHTAITGVPATEWHTLTSLITELRHTQRQQQQLHTRRGNRPRTTAPAAGPKPTLTPADRLLATVLYQRHNLPQNVIADLLHLSLTTTNRAITDTRRLLQQVGHVISPAQTPLRTLQDLHDLAHTNGITTPTNQKAASY